MGMQELIELGYEDDDDNEVEVGYVDELGFFRPKKRKAKPRRMALRAPSPVGAAVPAVRRLLATPPGGPGTQGSAAVVETLCGASAIVTFPAAAVGAATVLIPVYKRTKPTRMLVGYTFTGTPGVLVTCTAAMNAGRNQLGGGGAVDVVNAWGPTNTYVKLNWEVIDPTQPLQLSIITSGALAAGSSQTLSFQLYGIQLS
jgi:hypothetical protein